MPILYITKVQLPGREKYLSAAAQDLAEVSWGDPISRMSYKKPEVRRALRQVAEEGYEKGLEVSFTVPKSVSIAAEVQGDTRVREAVIRQAMVPEWRFLGLNQRFNHSKPCSRLKVYV